ncbi:MAG: hypothetical protein ACI867_001783, partial [Glaciecola sp.]
MASDLHEPLKSGCNDGRDAPQSNSEEMQIKCTRRRSAPGANPKSAGEVLGSDVVQELAELSDLFIGIDVA